EIGAKTRLLGRALRLNVAAFYDVYKDMQYIETDPVPFDGGIANIPSVHIHGVEAEGSYVALGDRLRLDASLALEDGKVQGAYRTIDSTVANAIESQPFPSPCAFGGAFYNPACWAAVTAAARNIGGNVPPAMPKVSGSADLSYRFDVVGGSLTPRVEVIHRGAEWARIFNEPGLDRVKAYTVTNLDLEYRPANGRFTLSIAATNLFDTAGVNSRYVDPYGTAQTSQQYIPPRQVIGTIGVSF
ncbi:MAG: TonB-dependent receptor, partial [Caulobacteraceae bacterium]|nr:TonB-dependent receptor [Caulobacteraceae bacterium]